MIASAFAVVFGIFIASFVILCGFIVTWALRRDRTNWREWRARQSDPPTN